jgi:hypothetical protein
VGGFGLDDILHKVSTRGDEVALFNKHSSGDTEPDTAVDQERAAAIDPQTIDLDDAAQTVEGLCSVIGGSLEQLEEAARRLGAASGMPDPDNAGAVMAAYRQEGKYSTTRCWRWLSAVAQKANAAGRPELAAMVYLWSGWWIGAGFEAWANGGNHIAIGIDAAPESEILAIIDSGQAALGELPDDLTLVETIAEPVSVTMARSHLNNLIELRDSVGIKRYREQMREVMAD